ncbi:phage exclusion lipoprotein Cor [Dryocola clanedunensis]
MKRYIAIALAVFVLSGCSGMLERQQPVCTATAVVGGQSSTVQIYDVKKINGQTKYKAGYPFNWQYISKSNFTHSTCE